MVTYDSAAIFIRTAVDNKAKIEKIDLIISALEDTAAESALNDDIEEYWLDDGQSKIKTVYKGTEAVLKSIMDFEKLRQMYVNRLNGRQVRLVDGKSLRNQRRHGLI